MSYFALPLLLLLSIARKFASGTKFECSRRSTPDPISSRRLGEIGGLEEFGSSGTQVGLAVSTTSCNAGDTVVRFFAIPGTKHPIIPHNLYRMSGGAGNDERFEQIGHSWAKHAFGADQANNCFSCQPGGDFNHLGVGCSDTYANYQNAEQDLLGSRALINPFTGVFLNSARNHAGHVHTGTSHRILVEGSDLNTTLNPGATYYAEVQYITPDDMNGPSHPAMQHVHNTSYRRYNVSGTTIFTCTEGDECPPGRCRHACSERRLIRLTLPDDGRAFIAYKVTNPSAGVWHYEYAIYNQNLDRAIQSFSLPLGCGITVSNLGFHAPLNHPGSPNDGTQGNAGFSNAAWPSNQTPDALSWSTETFAQNQNANAIRWGTLYNFRFDSDRPPYAANATIGFFTTGTPIAVGVQGPMPCNATPSPTVTPSPTPPGTAQAINLSTRMRVQTGDNVGIGGFIITGTGPKHVLLRALGPSLTPGVQNTLADPMLALHDEAAFVMRTNDNWREDPVQEAAILATGLAPTNNLESAIDATLNPSAYTAIVRGNGNASGIGLVELYDLNPEALSKLGNISTRALVGTGDNTVIAGFILGSHSDADRIVVRGIGPSLTAHGVPNALADPTLELRDNNGALLMANNDWQDDPAQAAELTAAGLAPTDPLESGISTTRPAGVYTALLSGVTTALASAWSSHDLVRVAIIARC